MRVLQLGMGAVGRENVRQLLARGHEVVGIVDQREDLQSEVASHFPQLIAGERVMVSSDLDYCLNRSQPDVILQATSFDESSMLDTVKSAARTGANLVTINGLTFIAKRFPALFASIDSIARYTGIRVLGAGSIPGFLSDMLPLFLTGACAEVKRISIRRVSDFSGWGPDVMGRYGFGLSPDAFNAKVSGGEIKLFQSLWQSADIITSSLGWTVKAEHEKKEAIVSESHRTGSYVSVAPGTVGGFSHTVNVVSDQGHSLHIEVVGLISPQGSDEMPSMTIEIAGNPGMRMTLDGDIALSGGALASSSARMVNSISRLSQVAPGLRTTFDLPIVACV